MDVFELLRGTGLPHDVIRLIDKLVKFRPPVRIKHLTTIDRNARLIDYDNIIAVAELGMSGYLEISCFDIDDLQFYDVFSSRFFKKILPDNKALIMTDGTLYEISLKTKQKRLAEGEFIYGMTKYIQLDGVCQEILLCCTRRIFYSHTQKTFFTTYTHSNSTINIVAEHYDRRREITPTGVIEEFTTSSDVRSVWTYPNFAIAVFNDFVSVIFKDHSTVIANSACYFDDESLLYECGGIIYYKHIDGPILPVECPKSIDLITEVRMGEKFVYSPHMQPEVSIGIIEYAETWWV